MVDQLKCVLVVGDSRPPVVVMKLLVAIAMSEHAVLAKKKGSGHALSAQSDNIEATDLFRAVAACRRPLEAVATVRTQPLELFISHKLEIFDHTPVNLDFNAFELAQLGYFLGESFQF